VTILRSFWKERNLEWIQREVLPQVHAGLDENQRRVLDLMLEGEKTNHSACRGVRNCRLAQKRASRRDQRVTDMLKKRLRRADHVMASHLPNLAKRLEDDPYFLACSLKQYAMSERLSDPELATVLGCTVESLTPIRLCRNPGIEAQQFQHDTSSIAERFSLRVDALRKAVRRGQAIAELRRRMEPRGLAAARDRDERSDHPPCEGILREYSTLGSELSRSFWNWLAPSHPSRATWSLPSALLCR